MSSADGAERKQKPRPTQLGGFCLRRREAARGEQAERDSRKRGAVVSSADDRLQRERPGQGRSFRVF